MKNTLVKKICAFLPVLAILIFPQIWAFAQNGGEKQAATSPNAISIEGVWRSEITPVDCQTGQPILPFTIPGLLTYHSDGTIAETGGGPGGVALRSPGHGVWKRINSRTYEGSFVFLTFNPDGSFAGTERINQNLQLNQDATEFHDTATFQFFDPTGNQVASGCARAVGTRFQ